MDKEILERIEEIDENREMMEIEREKRRVMEKKWKGLVS